MKNLVIYVENYVYGGLEKFLFDLIQNSNYNLLLLFNKENDRVLKFAQENEIRYTILNIQKTRKLPDFKIRILDVITHVLSFYKIYFDIFLNTRYLSQLFKKIGVFDNLLIINGGYPAAQSCRSAAIAAKKQKIRNVIFTILSNPAPYNEIMFSPSPTFLLSRLNNLLHLIINTNIDRKVINSVNKFHVNCYAIKNNLMKSMRFPPGKIAIVYTGITIPNSAQIAKVNKINNDYLSIVKNKGEYWFGTTGFLTRLKGQKFFLQAMKIVKAGGFSNVRGLIVGDGPDYKFLTKLTKKLGLEKEVIFSGKYPYDISDIYRFLDIFVFTSLHEGLPYVISEAMSYKLPIISTNVGGIPEQIKDGINGSLVEKANAQALSNKIIWMLNNQARWSEMGESSYEHAKERFAITAMVRKIDNLLF